MKIINPNMPILQPLGFPKGLGYFKTLVTYTRLWRVVRDYKLKIPNHPGIVIPKGFVFDGASIPKIFRNLVSPTGILLIPGLIHDFGYRYNYLLRDIGCLGIHDLKSWNCGRYMKKAGKDAFDELFLETANYVNGLEIINNAAYLAVKYGGNGAWKSHEKTQIK